MERAIKLWIIGAFCMFFYSSGVDAGCRRTTPSVQNPIAFLGWPAAAIAVWSGWKAPEGTTVCGEKE